MAITTFAASADASNEVMAGAAGARCARFDTAALAKQPSGTAMGASWRHMRFRRRRTWRSGKHPSSLECVVKRACRFQVRHQTGTVEILQSHSADESVAEREEAGQPDRGVWCSSRAGSAVAVTGDREWSVSAG